MPSNEPSHELQWFEDKVKHQVSTDIHWQYFVRLKIAFNRLDLLIVWQKSGQVPSKNINTVITIIDNEDGVVKM